jgi:hypothetical protein
MPYKEKKLPSGKYQVKSPSGVHAKGTTKVKADAQMRLLRGIEHGMVPRKSVKGSAPFTADEICQGYRKI